jgi:amino acid permease
MDDNIQFKINNPDIAVTNLRILGAQQFLTATESTQVTFHIFFSLSSLSLSLILLTLVAVCHIPFGLALLSHNPAVQD